MYIDNKLINEKSSKVTKLTTTSKQVVYGLSLSKGEIKIYLIDNEGSLKKVKEFSTHLKNPQVLVRPQYFTLLETNSKGNIEGIEIVSLD